MLCFLNVILRKMYLKPVDCLIKEFDIVESGVVEVKEV